MESGLSQHNRVDTVSSDSTSDEKVRQPLSRACTPSVFRVGRLTGLAALLFAFLQIFASCAILLASDGDLVSNWQYQPSVYLAILTAISNKALAFATIQGTVVTIWFKAARGTTLGQLHRDWVGLDAMATWLEAVSPRA